MKKLVKENVIAQIIGIPFAVIVGVFVAWIIQDAIFDPSRNDQPPEVPQADTPVPTHTPVASIENFNQLTNGDFSNGLDGWSPKFDERVYISTKGFSGSGVCSYQSRTEEEAPNWVGIKQKDIELEYGKTYKFIGYFRWANVEQLHIKLTWKNDDTGTEPGQISEAIDHEMSTDRFARVEDTANSDRGWIRVESRDFTTRNEGSVLDELVIWHGVKDGAKTNATGSSVCMDSLVLVEVE